jgi:hypothetical protein
MSEGSPPSGAEGHVERGTCRQGVATLMQGWRSHLDHGPVPVHALGARMKNGNPGSKQHPGGHGKRDSERQM